MKIFLNALLVISCLVLLVFAAIIFGIPWFNQRSVENLAVHGTIIAIRDEGGCVAKIYVRQQKDTSALLWRPCDNDSLIRFMRPGDELVK